MPLYEYRCTQCGHRFEKIQSFSAEAEVECPKCGGLVDVAYDWPRLAPPVSLAYFESKWAERTDPLNLSGVWRFRELLPFAPPDQILTIYQAAY